MGIGGAHDGLGRGKEAPFLCPIFNNVRTHVRIYQRATETPANAVKTRHLSVSHQDCRRDHRRTSTEAAAGTRQRHPLRLFLCH